MEPLILEATEDTPKVVLDTEENFSISGRSLPENAIGFYQPVFEWLEKYIENPGNKTVIDFKLEYFNTASAKQIAKILLFLEKLSKRQEVLVRWFYQAEDIDMLSSGQRFDKLIEVNFEIIEEKQ